MKHTAPLLEISGLDASYGETRVLWQVSLTVPAGEIVALVGANGAGKTTLLKTVTGLLVPTAGQITLAGRDITGVPAERRVGEGVTMVPEGRRLFAGMTVEENLNIGAFTRSDARTRASTRERVYQFFPELAELRDRLAGNLSGGQQQMCAIGRALMIRPRLLLIDEMSLGLAPVVVERIAKVVADLNREDGVTVLLVEQDVELALEIADSGYVLDTGRIVMQGPAKDLLDRPEIQEAYLGFV